jgi:membrane-associated phospholipid phosphatase
MLKSPWPYKIFLLLVFGVAYSIFYVYPNFHPTFSPAGLPFSVLETRIPFIPWTILIYTSDYVYMGLTVVLLDDRVSFHRFARQALLVLIFGGFFFWFFPTMIPSRIESFDDEAFIVRWLLDLVHRLDAPTNCFPSLHVGFTGVALWNLRHKGGRVFGLFFVWAVLITLSVLTTKQHYIWDVLGGIGLVVAAVCFERWLSRYSYLRHWISRWESTGWWDSTL